MVLIFKNINSNTDCNKSQCDYKGESIRSELFLILSVPFGKDVQIRKKFITAKRLKDFGCRDETGERRTEGSSKTSGVVQRSKSRNQFHHLKTVLQSPFTRIVALAEFFKLIYCSVNVIIGISSSVTQHARSRNSCE